jgi:cyclophilin family peptidyl-prolyl cis-trans isomerase
MSLQHVFGSRRTQRRARPGLPVRSIVEGLESRTMFNVTQTAAVSPVQLAPGTSSSAIDLSQHFTDPLVTGSAVVIETTQGNIALNLLDTTAPKTVANFLSYVNAGSYANTVIQRAVPGFILQGGGFTADQNHISTTTPIANEFSVSNTVGTIAMALSTDPNTQVADPASATSDWFINDGNNAATLDPQKFTVFGNVLYDGMQVVNDIEADAKGSVSPTFVPSAGDPPDGVLPLAPGYNIGSPILPTNYVLTNTIVQVIPVSFTVASDNTALVNGSVSGTDLTVVAGSGTGLAHLTITATDLGNNSVQEVVTVQVGATQVTLGNGAARSVSFADPDGTHSQITYAGAGLATISFTGLNLSITGSATAKSLSGSPLAVTISTTGTSASNSALTITGKGGANNMVDIAGIKLDGSMRSITGRNTNLTADLVAVLGSIGTLTLGSVTSANINLGSGAPIRFTVGAMNTASLFDKGAITSVTANSWTGGGDVFGTAIGQVRIKGAFVGTVEGKSVSSFTAASIGAGDWAITGAVGSITTKSIDSWRATLGTLGRLMDLGAMTSSKLNTTGNIASISAASMTGSTVFAGVAAGAFPSSNSDFSSMATIGSLSLKGTFANSFIASAHFTSLSFGPITFANNGSPFGLAALSIKQLKLTFGRKKITLRNVVSATQVTNVFTALGVAPEDLTFRIL